MTRNKPYPRYLICIPTYNVGMVGWLWSTPAEPHVPSLGHRSLKDQADEISQLSHLISPQPPSS